jgi:uncharacterized protein involved in exopolysaccharide biosynthesis
MYRDTIRRHRRLLLAPILVCLGMALWTVAGSPKEYQSTVSLWVDNPPPAASSLVQQDVVQTPPADAQQLVVDELLTTKSFRLAIGHHSPLAAYLGSNPSKGWGPTALLPFGGGGSVDDEIVGALTAKKVTTTVAGPQVLQISYKSPSPAVAAGTLRALVTEFNAQLAKLGRERDRAALGFYQGQVAVASRAVTDAKQAVTKYVSTHPGATAAGDPELRALVKTQHATGPVLTHATTRLNQAAGAIAEPSASGAHASVIDPAATPTAPASGKKKLILAVFGGAFVGALISFLILIALTPAGPAGREVVLEGPWEANGHGVESPVRPFAPRAGERA